MEMILNAINIVLTLLLGVYVVYINRRPEIEKISHNKVMSLLKEKHLEALEWWKNIDKYIDKRQRNDLHIYFQILNKKISDDKRDIDTKIKAKQAIEKITDEEKAKMRGVSEEDNEAMRFVSNVTDNAVANICSLKYSLPKNFGNLLNESEDKLLRSSYAGTTEINKDLLDNSIRFLYKYLKTLEIAYYSGMDSKLIIDKDDLILAKEL